MSIKLRRYCLFTQINSDTSVTPRLLLVHTNGITRLSPSMALKSFIDTVDVRPELDHGGTFSGALFVMLSGGLGQKYMRRGEGL